MTSETSNSTSESSGQSPEISASGNSESVEANSARANKEFIQLFTRAQRKLFLYILSKVGRPSDAEDILQETNLAIWSKSDQFEMGTNFGAWTNRIALFEILRFRQKKSRSKLQFSDDFISQIAEATDQSIDKWEEKQNALENCLEKLRDKDKSLIQQRYSPGMTGKQLAKSIDRPQNAVYQSLARIRRSLLECIERHQKSKSRNSPSSPHQSGAEA